MGRTFEAAHPLFDDTQITQIFEFCLSVFNDESGVIFAANKISYVTSVLMPEAVKFGLQTALDMTEEEADTAQIKPVRKESEL